MIVKKELINQIKEYFNLNIYETKVWLALLGKGVASAGEVAEISGVPRSRTYDVLESLEKRGFAIVKLGKPIKYIAVKPNTIIEKLKSNTEKNAKEKIKTFSNLTETNEYQELEKLYNGGIKPVKHNELSGAIKGDSTIYSHIREILENTKKEVMICSSTKEFFHKLRFYSKILDNLKKSNVKIKIALSGDEKDIKKIKNKLKIEIKPIKIDSHFYIVDKEQVLFSITNGNSEEDLAIWLNTPFFTTSLAFMFEQATK